MTRLRSKNWDTEVPPDCDCCGYPAPLKTFGEGPPGKEREVALCEICAHSHIGNDYVFGTEAHAVTRAIAFAANAVLDQLGAFPPPAQAGGTDIPLS